MPSAFSIKNSDARKALMAMQGLSLPRKRRLTRRDLTDLINQLGYVQVDSINTVERAHHLILFARNQTYSHRQLRHLIEKDAALFENWTHDASIIPSDYFPYWISRFKRERGRLLERWRRWRREGFEEKLEDVLEHVRAGGPVMARQFSNARKKARYGWWDWHPSKTALEYLWRTGELAVTRREGFQKVYDLTERVIPACFRTEPPSTESLIEWACRGALDRLVFAAPSDIAAFWGSITTAEASAWCERNSGTNCIRVLVETADGSKPKLAYGRKDLPELLDDLPSPLGQIRVLSPFDPLIRNRSRTKYLFDFRYRIEIFVPEPKRQYGYYVFPLLERDRFIGRIDMRHLREREVLNVKNLWLEPRFKMTQIRLAKLTAELDAICKFIGASRVVFQNDFLAR